MKNLNLTLMLLFLAVISFAQNVPTYVPTNGLVGWWPFNGNANDESGNGNNGTVNGATLTTDRFGNTGKAYDFDGVNDWIQVTDTPGLRLQTGTLSCWLQYTSLQKMQLIIKQNINNANNSNYDIVINDYNQILGIGPWSQGMYVNSCGFQTNWTQNIPDIDLSGNIWHHVVSIYDQNVMKIYFDGLLVSTKNTAQQLMNACSDSDLLFGRGWQNFPLWYEGKLDDVAIWNRALDSTEIAALYNSSTSTATIQNNLSNDIKIFPNPTYDHITIDAGNLNTMSGYSIRIVNALGQQVFQSAINQQQFYLDLSSWTGNGIYYVNIINPQGVTIDTRKIVLQ
jgi:hypothetical protein